MKTIFFVRTPHQQGHLLTVNILVVGLSQVDRRGLGRTVVDLIEFTGRSDIATARLGSSPQLQVDRAGLGRGNVLTSLLSKL